jgi:hypothetical protein
MIVRRRFSTHSALFDHHFMIAALMFVLQRASLVDAISQQRHTSTFSELRKHEGRSFGGVLGSRPSWRRSAPSSIVRIHRLSISQRQAAATDPLDCHTPAPKKITIASDMPTSVMTSRKVSLRTPAGCHMSPDRRHPMAEAPFALARG